MYTSHPINAQFDESMLRIQSVFSTHPLLHAKSTVVTQMDAQQVTKVPALLNQFRSLLIQERVLWSNIQFKPTYKPIASQTSLDEHQKRFVLANAKAVRRVCGTAFERLEQASVHQGLTYRDMVEDFFMFQQIVEGLGQLDTMQSHLDRQELLATRVGAHVNSADLLYARIGDLRASMLDQQAIASRLPPFMIQKGDVK